MQPTVFCPFPKSMIKPLGCFNLYLEAPEMKISLFTPKRPTCLIFMLPQKQIEKGPYSPSLVHLVGKLRKDKVFTGKTHQTLFLPHISMMNSTHLLLVGLGEENKINPEALRQGAAKALHNLEQNAQTQATLDLTGLKTFVPDSRTLGRVVAEGFYLAAYQFNELKKKSSDRQEVKHIFLKTSGGISVSDLNKGLTEAKYLGEGTNWARWIADHPANLMTPAILADTVKSRMEGLNNLKVSVWNKARIQKEKMGGLLGVSLGSSQEPRLIQMEYRGSIQKNTGKKPKPVCFVGKGLTFDSGGISLKPAAGMDEMKFDMCGACAVIGAVLAIARLKLKVDVIGLVGAAENMPGASANKPGDILRARNGKTMEVLNTDAEGRLVLADVLSYACEKNPALIVDLATLTGAVVVALSNTYTGLFTRNKTLKEQMMKAARLSGEKVWPLPLDDFHVRDIKGHVGDVANISSTKGAGSSTAAAFLEQFVAKGIPWLHLDIAGTAYNVANRLPYCRPKSASGVMVRTLVEMAKSLEQ